MRQLLLFSSLIIFLNFIILTSSTFAQIKMGNEPLNFIHGTCILTLITKDSIWIASDSKEGEIIDTIKSSAKRAAACKIHNYNNIYYCVSGTHLVSGDKSGVLLDAEQEVLDVLKSNRSFFENFKACNDVIMPKLAIVCQKMNRKFLQENPDILQISMSSFTRNRLPMHINWGYRVSIDGQMLKIEPITVSRIDPKQGISPELSPQGITDGVVSYLSTHKRFFQGKQDMKDMLITLIKYQASKNSDVGPPVIVKVIYPTGSSWQTAHRACQ